ncbi:putative transcription factor C2H2 family [Lupinus albus]|uniref:Putative transcription factor C2H2 family n=1 Tax=Lupinus albus TaxID=3870 RepID=A0A6A4QXI9_LUPAL|nr:putative transcription factor C2H2 family [Lupinus albus]
METGHNNDSLDTVIGQAFGKESFLSFPRADDNPIQWIQLLHALDQQELPGLPFFSPVKIRLQKCDKCSREFCSPINYRRHIRVHHRLKKHDKDSKINRDLLGAYWDKLSVEEAMELVSFRNVMLEEIPGSSVLIALTTLIKNHIFSPLPQYYLRAGSALLDIIESRPSSFPISSKELFSILDDSSETTFLCGTAMSMQRYVFDGEAGKIGLEPKNLVACTSFLLEQKLVKAWLADKDAEALRCQKLLMEEEDAAQRRQARILEKKHKKKVRQKEQKARGRFVADTEIKQNNRSTVEAVSPEEASMDAHDFEAHNPDTIVSHAPSPNVTIHCPETTEVVDGGPQSRSDCVTYPNIEQQRSQGHNRQRTIVARQHGLPKSQRDLSNGLHASENSHTPKLEVIQKSSTLHEQKESRIFTSSKVWSRKPKPEIGRVMSDARLQKEPEQENLSKQNSAQEMPMKSDSSQSGNPVKLWRPVNQHGTEDSAALQSGGTEADSVYGIDDQTLSGQSSLKLCNIDGSDIGSRNNLSYLGAKVDPENFHLSSHAAKAFLAQRWKEAISSNHVKLVVYDPPGCSEVQN